MGLTNTKYGTEKQLNREHVTKVFKKHFRKNFQGVFLSMPAEQGLKGILSKSSPSFEGAMSQHFKNVALLGVEGVRAYYETLKPILKRVSKQISVKNSTDKAFFNKTMVKIDGAWLDNFGGTSQVAQDTLEIAVENQVFNDKAVLSVTLCETPRTVKCKAVRRLYRNSQDGTLASGHFNWFKKCAKRFGYRVEFIDAFSYRNTDLSNNAAQMVTVSYKLTKI